MQISAELLDRCRAADRQAQEAVYRICYSPMMRLALRYAHNEQDAADILNRAFLKVFTKVHQFKGEAKVWGGWIKRIMINESLDFVRAQQKRSEKRQLTEVPEQGDEGQLSQMMEQEQLIHLLQQLPSTTATVFNLYAMEGYSHKEIGQLLQISSSNSKWHLHSARKKLQNLLQKKAAL